MRRLNCSIKLGLEFYTGIVIGIMLEEQITNKGIIILLPFVGITIVFKK